MNISISRLLENIGLFCKRALPKRQYSEHTYIRTWISGFEWLALYRIDSMTHLCVTWLTHVWLISCVTWLFHTWHASFICDMTLSYVTWLICVWHDSFICDTTHSCVTYLIRIWHDSFTCDVTCLCVTLLLYMWHGTFMCDMSSSHVTRLAHVWHNEISHTWMSRGVVPQDSFTCDMVL